MDICNDKVFGELTYKHRWTKEEELFLFGKKWKVIIAVKAYSHKPVTDEQRKSYQRFKNEYSDLSQKIETLAIDYINDHCEEFSSTWIGARNVKNANELATILKPRSVLFKQDGETIILLDCPWSEEGVGIRLFPTETIGGQDLFL